MTTYRVGNHQPQNVYRGEQYIGVMFTAEDAALTVEALNGLHRYAAGGEWDNAKPYRIYSRWVQAQDRSSRSVYAAILEAYAVGLASEPSGPKPIIDAADVTPEQMDEFVEAYRQLTDSCTCTIVGPDPGCPVHQGRRARGPKPPPVGPACICDGSGRDCPRHGAVI